MSGPENPENQWGKEGQSDPTRIIPNPIPPAGQQPYNPQQWSQNPGQQGQPAPPPPPQPGAWSQPPPPQTPAWGMPAQPPQGPPPGQQSWGQPPQQPPGQGWGQPPGQPQPWQQPGQPEYGQFPQPTGQGKSKLPLILALVGVVVVLLVVAVVAIFFMNRSQVLDQASVESGVETILTDSYGLQGVSGAECPTDQKVETGTTFTCSVNVDGEARSVTLRIIDDDGTYEVSKPQ